VVIVVVFVVLGLSAIKVPLVVVDAVLAFLLMLVLVVVKLVVEVLVFQLVLAPVLLIATPCKESLLSVM